MQSQLPFILEKVSKKELNKMLLINNEKTQMMVLTELAKRKAAIFNTDLRCDIRDKYGLSEKEWLTGLANINIRWDNLFNGVLSDGNLAGFCYLKELFNPKFYDGDVYSAISGDNVKILEMLLAQGLKLPKNAAESAAKHGSLNVLEWMKKSNYQIGYDTARQAISGRFGLLNGYGPKNKLDDLTKTKKYIKVSKWLEEEFGYIPYGMQEENFRWYQSKEKPIFYREGQKKDLMEFEKVIIYSADQDAANWAANNGMLDVVKTLGLERNIWPEIKGLWNIWNHFEVVEFLVSQDKLPKQIPKQIPYDLKMSIYKWLDSKGFIMEDVQTTFKWALFHENIELLDWLIDEKGYVPTEADFEKVWEFYGKTAAWAKQRGYNWVKEANVDNFKEILYLDTKRIKYLLKKGLRPNMEDVNMLCEFCQLENLILLSKWGILPDKDGARKAYKQGSMTIVYWLETKGIKI